MDRALKPREIVRAARLCTIGKRQWLLVADFAEIEGRIECVGIELRSFVRCDASVASDGSAAEYPAYWGGPSDLPDAGLNPEALARLYPVGDELRDLSGSDRLAVDAGAHRVDKLRRPHKLDSKTLRGLALADQLDRIRRQLVAEDAGSAELRAQDNALESFLVGTVLEHAEERGDEKSVDLLKQYGERRDRAHGAMDAGRRRPGRPRKYDEATLRTVARLYTDAYRRGSRSPTREVARKTEIPYGMVGKLVMRCREAGLLEPAKPRTAGGVKLTSEAAE